MLLTCVFEAKSMASRKHWNSLGFINICVWGEIHGLKKTLKFLRFYWHLCLRPNPWPQELLILAYTCDKKLHRNMGGTIGRWTRGSRKGRQISKIGLATERRSRHWSVVSCVRCGCVGAGLGFPVGVSAPLRFHPQPPIRCLEHNDSVTSIRHSKIIEMC